MFAHLFARACACVRAGKRAGRARAGAGRAGGRAQGGRAGAGRAGGRVCAPQEGDSETLGNRGPLLRRGCGQRRLQRKGGWVGWLAFCAGPMSSRSSRRAIGPCDAGERALQRSLGAWHLRHCCSDLAGSELVLQGRLKTWDSGITGGAQFGCGP